MRVLENPLRIGAEHPTMKNGVAALAQDNETGLNGVCFVKNLFRRVANDDIRFEFDLSLLCAFADRNKTLLETLTPLIEDRIKLRALAGSGGRITAKTKSLAFISPAIDKATFIACSACGDASKATSIL